MVNTRGRSDQIKHKYIKTFHRKFRNKVIIKYKFYLKNKNVKFGVAIADIDDFKKINDTYGHDCGDYVLKKIANILGKYPTDKLKVFRFGGEEIIFIYTNDFCVYDLFEKMRKEVNSYNFIFNKHKFRISMTFGISPLGDNFDELFKAADELLYVGKKSGKNNVMY